MDPINGSVTNNQHNKLRYVTPLATDYKDTINLEINRDACHKNGTEKAGLKFLAALPARQKCILILSTIAVFLTSLADSLFGPVFTTEAVIKRGVSVSIVGIVFGIFQVTTMITSPYFGTYLVKLGPRFVLISGIFMVGSGYTLFGCLRFCPNGPPFIVMSILIRLVAAVGFSGFITSDYALVSNEFKDNVGFTFSILQTGSGLGYITGPLLGGILHDLGGFDLPFYCAGVAICLNGIAMCVLLPPVENIPEKRRGSTLTLLQNPFVIVAVLCVFINVVGTATLDTTQAKHLEPMHFSVFIVGLFFSIQALAFSASAPICGYISDSKSVQAPLIIAGSLLFGIGFLLLGPSNLLPFLPYDVVTISLGLVCVGISLGCTYISAMKWMVLGAIEIGFQNNIDTNALVSGLFISVMSLGGFIGPLTAGVLAEVLGYPVAFTIVGMCSIVLAVACLIFYLHREYKRTFLRRDQCLKVT